MVFLGVQGGIFGSKVVCFGVQFVVDLWFLGGPRWVFGVQGVFWGVKSGVLGSSLVFLGFKGGFLGQKWWFLGAR